MSRQVTCILLLVVISMIACNAVPLFNSSNTPVPSALPAETATPLVLVPTIISPATPTTIPIVPLSGNMKCVEASKETLEFRSMYTPFGNKRLLGPLLKLLREANVNCIAIVFLLDKPADAVRAAEAWIAAAHKHEMSVILTFQTDTRPGELFDRYNFQKMALAAYSDIANLLQPGDVVNPFYRVDDRTVQRHNCDSNCWFNSPQDLGRFIKIYHPKVVQVVPSFVHVGLLDFGSYQIWCQAFDCNNPSAWIPTTSMREGFIDSVPRNIDLHVTKVQKMENAQQFLGKKSCFGTWGPLTGESGTDVYEIFMAAQAHFGCSIYAISGPNGTGINMTYYDETDKQYHPVNEWFIPIKKAYGATSP